MGFGPRLAAAERPAASGLDFPPLGTRASLSSTKSDSVWAQQRRARERLLAEDVAGDYTVITMATTTRIVRIGNSQGIRIPKPLLDQAQLPEEVELRAEPGRLVVRAARGPRYGWADAARAMRARHEDGLLDEATPTTFDVEEWTW